MVSLALDTPELAQVYDVRGQRQYEHGQLLIADLGVAPGQSVLDVGAGTGLLAAYVADLVGPKGRVVGIDPLPLRIEIAKARGRRNLTFQVARAEELGAFAPGTFDVVYLNSVFHWLPNKHAALSEIFRVLKPNGRVGLSTAALERPHSVELVRQRALVAAGLAERAHVARGILHRVSSEVVDSLFRDTGFRKLQLEIRTFVDYDDNVDGILEFSRSSSFGNDLAALDDDDERKRLRAALEKEFEASRDAQGIRQERHLIFAVAEKVG